MTQSLRFTVFVDTDLPATDGLGRPLSFHERGADRLAAALAALGQDVVSQEAPLLAAAPNRWLLYFGADPAEALDRCGPRRSALKSRLIILDVDRVTADELMQTLQLPLIVTSRSFRNWLDNPSVRAQVVAPTMLARTLGIALPPRDAATLQTLFAIPDVPLPHGIVRCCAASAPLIAPAAE